MSKELYKRIAEVALTKLQYRSECGQLAHVPEQSALEDMILDYCTVDEDTEQEVEEQADYIATTFERGLTITIPRATILEHPYKDMTPQERYARYFWLVGYLIETTGGYDISDHSDYAPVHVTFLNGADVIDLARFVDWEADYEYVTNDYTFYEDDCNIYVLSR